MAQKDNKILREAEKALDPLAEARKVADGKWSPLDDPEDAKEFLKDVERLERAERELQLAEADVRNDAAASRRSAKLLELRSIRTKLRESADGHRYRAASLVVGREHERLSDSDYQAFRRAVNATTADIALEREFAELQEREAEQVRVTREVGPYEKGSPHSYVRDVLVNADPSLRSMAAGRSGESDTRPKAVEERLARHGKDVLRALVRRDAYGKTIEATLREQNRGNDADAHRTVYRKQLRELRSGLITGGGTTASASGGFAAAFAPPAFLMAEWSAYRSPYRAFADQCDTSVALPSYGLTVYLPQVSGGVSVTSETELAGVSETDPTTALLNSPIVLKAGQVTVTQQFLDRVGPGIAGDAVLFTQLKEQLSAQVDQYALSSVLANAPVTNSSAFALTTVSGVGGFLGDLKHAKSKVTDTAGVRLRGTHAFATGDLVDFIGSYADSGGRRSSRRTTTTTISRSARGRITIPAVPRATRATCWSDWRFSPMTTFRISGVTLRLSCVKPSTILHMEAASVPYRIRPRMPEIWTQS